MRDHSPRYSSDEKLRFTGTRSEWFPCATDNTNSSQNVVNEIGRLLIVILGIVLVINAVLISVHVG
jgi:hypothetical protein